MATQTKIESGFTKTRATDYRELYCNFSETRLTPWDISLICSKMQSPGPNVPLVIEEQIAVIFSPQQFKVLAISLNNVIAAYENHYGAIHLRPELTATAATEEDLAKALTQAQEGATKKD